MFVLPSRGDCMPQAVIEAIASGLPVVATRVGAIPEMVNDGVNGYLVDDVETAAKRTSDLLRAPDRATEMGTAGREHVRRNFLSTRELEDWLRLYTELR